MSHIQSIQTEFLFEFTSKQQWIDKAQSWFSPYSSKDQRTICLDKNGNVLTSGKDFIDAEIMQTYPVKVYRLVRVSELVQKLVTEINEAKAIIEMNSDNDDGEIKCL